MSESEEGDAYIRQNTKPTPTLLAVATSYDTMNILTSYCIPA